MKLIAKVLALAGDVRCKRSSALRRAWRRGCKTPLCVAKMRDWGEVEAAGTYDRSWK
jgi:hypothetical protein